MALCIFFATRKGFPKGEVLTIKQATRQMMDAIPGLLTVVIILGGILSGWFTATESAAVACVYAFLITMLYYRDYKWHQLPVLVHRTVKTVSIVMILIGFASAFGQSLTMLDLPRQISELFTSISDNPIMILLAINVLLMVLGTLMDMAPLIMIMTPILFPVVEQFGVHPVHFGMVMMVNLGIGLITPPVGSVLFVASAVSNKTIEQVTRAMIPFFCALFAVLMLVTYVPGLSLWLPRAVGVLPPGVTAQDDVGEAFAGKEVAINVLGNDKNHDPNAAMFVRNIKLKPELGSAYADGDKIMFTPNPVVTGEVKMMYVITNGQGGSDRAYLTVNVKP